ncbi:MAG: fibronectin type III domain-containing protein, partial [Armatimonadetes bacterium]|nr:fibronectin type III domain-containing protein [Armatimonadota bacterium]
MSLKHCTRIILLMMCACLLAAVVAVPAHAYWANSGEKNPTGFTNGTGSWGSGTSCSKDYWYCWAINNANVKYGQTVRWNHGWTWAGRGWFQEDFWRPGWFSGSAAYSLARSLNTSNGTSDASKRTYSGCEQGCEWITLWTGAVNDVAARNGVYIDTTENIDSCQPAGSSITMVGHVMGYGDGWSYLNKWVLLGPFSSTSLANANGLDEANLYLYPYVENNKGTIIVDGLFGGKKPVSHDAGDCNNANSLNFATKWTNAANQAGYAMAWVYAPTGAAPRFAIGSDDGCKVWLNGTNIHTNDTNRGLTRDQDVTGSKSMPAGWNRVLFKVQNGPTASAWQGTISLRNGGDTMQEEPSVSFQTHRYDGYSIFNEQDGWFPKMTLANFNGVANPEHGLTIYTNNTTVTASGTVTAQFIPFWKTGFYQWGRGLSGADTYYKFTTNSTASWSHTATDVTGYRRFHFFGISKSGRTSGQASGSSGGWTYNKTGNCAWGAVFVDNVAPNNPSFSSVNAVSPTQINLAWAIPLDKGVGVADGAAEDSDSTNGGSCHYRRGDVGVNVRRGGTSVYGWGTGTSFNNTGLTPNTLYTYDIAARDNTGQSRGAWANTTSYAGSTSVYTLSPAPVAGSVTPSNLNPGAGDNVIWTNNLGWGAGGVEYFRYVWTQNATHTWADTETQWSSGALSLVPTAGGAWYLHVKGFNADDVANGTQSYSVDAVAYFNIGTITGGGGVACGSIDPAEMTYVGGSGGGDLAYQWYSVEGTSGPTVSDTLIAGATGASYDPPAGLTTTTTYNVLVTPSYGAAAFTSTPVTVTVNPTPAVPTNASENSRCGAGDVAFSATADSGCSVKWYDAATGGTVISTANPYTENLSATKTYYAASVSAESCESATRLAVTGTINDLPAAPTNASSNTRCGEGNVAFVVTPDDDCTVKWYDAATGGNVVSTANPYTASLSGTTTYYAASVGDDCESATRTAVTGTVFAIPAAPTNASANVRCGSGEVTFEVTPDDGCSVKWYDAETGGDLVSTDNPYATELTETTTL